MSNIYYSYNDISIVPAAITRVAHRNQCNPFVGEGANSSLPIFTAPMSSIVNLQNVDIYKKNKIIPILPRNISLSLRLKYLDKGYWIALSLKETEELSLDKLKDNQEYKICIDIANGHMQKLYDLVHSIHISKPNIKIMAGNIANPETIWTAMSAGVDYIRIGIGTGAGCITSSNTAIHYPIASLIKECIKIRNEWTYTTTKKSNLKIIADGGIRNYNDVIKALALGADYVMIGSVFASCMESNKQIWIDAEPYGEEGYTAPDPDNGLIMGLKDDWKHGTNITPLFHEFHGMASKQGQRDITGTKFHTAEGISKFIEITTTIPQWSENMTDYLRSAMSYCDSITLDEFRHKAKIIIISNNTYNSVNK